MKIIATLPSEYSESEVKAFADGVEYLKKLGHNVIAGSALRKGAKKTAAVSPDKLHEKIQKHIKNVDILITEVTKPDVKTGFDISKALSEKKIVLALKKEGTKANEAFQYVEGGNLRQLLVKEYRNDNISEVLDAALDEAKKKMDTKFILIISPEIDRYLDWAANTKRMHKAQIVRNSIENMMKRDKDYKNYLEE